MFYSLDEISSFVLLKIPSTLDFQKEKLKSIPPEDFAVLYLLDKLGNAQICGYYIQGSQLIENVYSFLSTQYSCIDIEILNAGSGDLNSFFPSERNKDLRFLLITSFVTPFFYPYMVIPREIDSSKYPSDPSSFSFKGSSSAESSSPTDNLTFESIRSRYNSDR